MTSEQDASQQADDLTPSLVARLRDGDAEAGTLLDQLYREAMTRFCFGYLGNLEQAEDAVQEVFCRVVQAGQVPENFRAWLCRIARNHCLNLLRSRARRQQLHALLENARFESTLTGNLSRLVQQERRSRIRHLLGALPVTQREVLTLRYGQKLSRSEIAHVLGISQSVVKSRLFEGLKKLRQHSSLLDEG